MNLARRAGPGCIFFCFGETYYGKGKTVAEAVKAWRKARGEELDNGFKSYINIVEANEKAWVHPMTGLLMRPEGAASAELIYDEVEI